MTNFTSKVPDYHYEEIYHKTPHMEMESELAKGLAGSQDKEDYNYHKGMELYNGMSGLQARFSNVYISFAFLILPVALLGITGNILSISILSRKTMRKSSINLILLGLGFWDIIAIIGISFAAGSHYCYLYMMTGDEDLFDYWWPRLGPALYAIALTGQHASNGFTLLATVERYIYVCMPLKARLLITRKRTLMGIIIVNLLTLLYNLPFCFEYSSSGPTEFRNSWFFQSFYSHTPELIISHGIPMGLLVFGNVKIWISLRNFNKRRPELRDGQNATDAKEISMTRITLTIIGLCLVSNMMQLLWLIFGGDPFLNDSFSGYMNLAMLLTMVLNSSLNFIIYCALGENFRKEFARLCCLRRNKSVKISNSPTITNKTSTKTTLVI